jgi:hypothetical protein
VAGQSDRGGHGDTPYAFVARIEAKPEKAEDVAALLTGAPPLAEAEPGTVDWYAAQTSPTTFWILTRSAAKTRAKRTSTARSRQH